MPLSLEQAIGQQFLLSFRGKREAPAELRAIMARQQIGGIVLFRAKNMGTLEELRALTAELQNVAEDAGQPRLLIAADQEGGQLMAVGQATPFPGNMALGATRSEKLAQKVGRAIGREMAALGINVDFAPVCDVNNNPANPVVGTRSFSEDPKLVGALGAAMVRGLQSAGVAAAAKHFPGHGDTGTDPHFAAPVLPHNLRRIRRVELPPFQAAIDAGVKMVMTAHIAFPALNGGGNAPATVSRALLDGLLRRKLGYGGVIVTDAMDMNAMEQGPGYIAEALAALAAGADLLLFNHDLTRVEAAWATAVQAARRGLLDADGAQRSAARILALKKWLSRREQPGLDAICSREHCELAHEVARRSMTLVRNEGDRLPLRLRAEDRVAVVTPVPEDLTPADTSSYLRPELAAAVRRHHGNVEAFSMAMNPGEGEVRALCERVAGFDAVLVGTINATQAPGQAALVQELVRRGTNVVAIAMRLPYDVAAYASVPAYCCTYSILPPAMDAAADALFGVADFPGKLPVTVENTATLAM